MAQAPSQAGLRQDVVQDRHEHLDLGGLLGGAPVAGLSWTPPPTASRTT
ncbi:hypothetical protein [Streptomyces olivaceoviridis]